MRLSSVIVSLACAFGLTSAASINNPFSYVPAPATIDECGTEEDLLKLVSYQLNPNPPLKGEVLVIDAEGFLKEDVVNGAKINLMVKVGVIKLLTKELDFCEESAKIDKPCPLKAGEQFLHHEVELPKEIPPGKYFVNVKVRNPDDKQVTCLIARANFGI
ncbi:Phosphatidylglycerol/phosphatidylinositol transfer protein [Linnemannia schmuckeri]|uniref:Phosphatidylglycerol/phosphatidylinositol transfer protein n=1 Tax=Linnemannia schmuckeri TaxID=64567 RepID=A0A9P5S676_9FUNG|nr:Phosphatidylglycerol/phosphatidylinositol transfer protein [Linnemannia schmuckeri]